LCAIATLRLAPARLLAWDGRDSERLLTAVLIAGIASNLIVLAIARPGDYLVQPWSALHPQLLVLLAVAAILIACGAFGIQQLRLPRVWFPLTLATFAALGVWIVQASPHPHVDVMTVYESAAQVLRHGHNPYSMTFPNIYNSADLYPEGTVSAGRVLLGF